MNYKYILALFLSLFILSCDETEPNEDNLFKGKKIVTIGDSLTSFCSWQHGWQPYLVEWFGFNWSKEETVNGTNGHAATAIGGTWVKPDSINSIYIRSLDTKYYNPDIIFLYVASNAPYSYWVSSDNTGTDWDGKVKQEKVYRGTEIDKSVSTLSAYKGIVENLMEDCPNAKIYLIGIMPIRYEIGMHPTEDFADLYPTDKPRFATMEDAKEYEMNERWPKHELVKAVAKLYNLPFIDLWEMSGITNENANIYYGPVSRDCTQVHPNDAGDLRVAECIRDFLIKEN